MTAKWKAAKAWGIAMGALAAAVLSAPAQSSSLPDAIKPGTGLIHIDPHAVVSKTVPLRKGQPVVVLVDPVKDGRPDAPSRKVGDVGTTVMFLWASSLSLDQDISTVVFNALSNQLTADGYRAVGDPQEAHDFVIDSVVKEFRYDLLDQNDLNITVEMTLREAKSAEVLWAGIVEEKFSRFAGVSGTTRNGVITSFGKGVSNWAIKASANIGENLLKIYPESMAFVERKGLPPVSQINGVKTLQAAAPHETVKPAAATAAPAASQAPGAGVASVPASTPTPTVAAATPPAPAARPVPAAAAPLPAPAPQVAASPAPSNPAATTPPSAAQTRPAAAAASANGKGILVLTTVPSKAKVYVDDVYYGTSPLKLEFDAGVKLVRVKHAGYKTATEKVSVRSGETTELEMELEP